MDLPDYYAVLGVGEDADSAALRRAYRQCALTCHPDANPGDGSAAARFLAVAAAYHTLNNPGRRAEYDRKRWYARARQQVSPAARVSGSGFVVATSQPQPPRRGDDVRLDLDIPYSLARRGGRLTLDLGDGGPCPDCGGSGKRIWVCWMCDGRGTIWQPAGPGMVAVFCPACEGRGLGGVVCPACRGTGRHDRPRRVNLVIGPNVLDAGEVRVPGAGQPGCCGGGPGDMVFRMRLFEAPDLDWD